MAFTSWTGLLASLVLSTGLSTARADAQAESQAGPTESLSPELRAVFIAEMQHLDSGLQRAVSSLARADWPGLEKTALEIKGSFILQQRLSSEQRAELHRVLPERFLALDRRFHAHAERLAAAAKRADAELAAFYTYRLTEACISCHAAYATHRFPSAARAAHDPKH